MFANSDLPLRAGFGLQSTPVDAARQPLPFAIAQGADGLAALWPRETTLMQTPHAQPHAGAIPDQQLDPVAGTVTKRVGAAVARRTPQRLLDFERQAVDAQAHIDGLDRQPQLFGADHRNRSRNHWPQAAASDAGQRIATTVCCRRTSISMVLEGSSLGACTRTGTRDDAKRFASTLPETLSAPIAMSLRS